ncbi:hypothetical protein [Nocardiopsis valliformis]|uniref:hypothetical protein n=1 Tax=Nocardiopsis valliformis TaxID=239974 RepID=UPI000344D998|nr:hypothetical protein [Nocardiopsis valliformis]
MRDRALTLLVTASVFSTALLSGASALAETTERELTQLPEIAEALHEDPLYVDDHMAEELGEDVVSEIRSLVEDGPYAVYVVLAEVPTETASAPGRIEEETGLDGAYYYMSHGFGVAGVEGGSQESIRLAIWQAEDEGTELSRPELLTESITLFQQEDFAEVYDARLAATIRGDEEGSGLRLTGGMGLALGGVIGAVLLGVVSAIRSKKAKGKQQIVSPEGPQ